MVMVMVFLQGEDEKSMAKMAVLGNVTLNIAELASRMNSQIEKKLPISLHIDGVDFQASLLVSFISSCRPNSVADLFC